MNIWALSEAAFFLGTLAVMYRAGKKQPERTQKALMQAFPGFLALVTPFALIETLSAFGISLFDAAWAFTPLNILTAMCALFLVVLGGGKLFGIVDTKLSEE